MRLLGSIWRLRRLSVVFVRTALATGLVLRQRQRHKTHNDHGPAGNAQDPPPPPPSHEPARKTTLTTETTPATQPTNQDHDMSAAAVLQAPTINAPSENWDDDFEFGASASTQGSAAHLAADSHRGPRKRASVALSETENWDDDYLHDDQQPGPSTQRRPSHTPRHSKGSTRTTTENWDDDFEDKSAAASPVREVAAWDSGDEHPERGASHQLQSRLPAQHRNEASFSSDDEDDHAEFGLNAHHDDDRTVTSSTRNRPFTMESVPEVPPLPAHSRLSPTRPMPLPASPTMSSFSATVSYAPSHYSSTAHLALRPTQSAGSSIDGQGRAFISHQPGVLRKPPPAASNNANRARRRLRKKSRPSRVDADIFELEDRGGYELTDEEARAARLARLAEHVSGMTSTETDLDEEPEDDDASYIPPVTPEPRGYYHQTSSRPHSSASGAVHGNHSVVSFAPGATPSSAIPVPAGTPSSSMAPSSPVRSPILSRLGSVKRWAKGARRLSTAPSDVSTTSPPAADPESSPASRPASMAFAQQRERARSPLGEPLNPGVHELQPLGASALQSKKSTNTLHQDENSKTSKSWFFRHDGGGPLRGRKSRDRMKDPPGNGANTSTTTTTSADLEQCPPNPVGFPRRGSAAGLEQEQEKEKDNEAKERRGILGLRRISLLGGGGHKRHRSGAEGNIAPTSPTETSFAGQLAGFSFPNEQRSPTEPDLLPPIALSPPSPSPPRKGAKLVAHTSEPIVQLDTSPSSVKFALSSQAASLGRNGTPTLEAQREVALRRNSLGDLKTLDGGLKIPARISRAQVGLKRDLGLVREFATCVDQLKQLQQAYLILLGELRILLESPASPTSPSSTSTRLFHLPRAPLARPSEGEPARKLQHIEHEYSIWWECAEVLIELGGTGANGPTSSASEPRNMGAAEEKERSGKRRERAVTLLSGEAPSTPSSSGPPQASPPSHWRASTGRHDLSQRQLVLLKQMLNSPDPATFVVGNVVAVTRARAREPSGTISVADSSFASAAGNSTSSESRVGLGLELPELDTRALSSSPVPSHGPSSPLSKARRGSRGITGLRELLKSFKRHGTAASSSVSNAATSRSDLPQTGSATTSSASVSAREDPPASTQATARQRKPRSSTGAQTVVSEQEAKRKREVHPNSPYGTVGAVPTAKTPRRPSLASLFRLAGSKSKISRQASQTETRRSEDADYSDWDRMESASDLDLPNGIAVPPVPETIRGSKRSRYSALQATPPATVRRTRSRSASRTRGASASRSSVNLAIPSTPSPSKGKALTSRMFRSTRPGSRDGPPPAAPSHGFAQALAGAAASNHVTPTQETENQRQQGRERSATTPSRRPVGSRSVSANHIPPVPHTDPLPSLPDPKVALTPENLGPLLDYAREVSARLSECVIELRTVLGQRNSPTPDIGSGSLPS
ncbi:hypothetical protein EXIGLDRAFT_759179 [Exidia glandulosa HHB12029]|uniref:Uncharacterized protein n=1 Tax=Exidia glandulosa HHB12029 TaxID=1314781 RepID=A0A165QA61_EXIGL|nr:hypothetical protein EXIGLDRAFT_759179 [Exidia glandulosa HHB12029]